MSLLTHTVTIDAAKFIPAELEVRAGDTIVWVNKDILAHTATSASGGFDSKVIESGKSWKYVAKKKGAFDYLCSFHPMNGRLIVR
jgi:plastocyanin